MTKRKKHPSLFRELTSELANHVLVLLQRVLQDFLCRVHLPAPLSTHRVGVMPVRGRYQIIEILQLLKYYSYNYSTKNITGRHYLMMHLRN